VPTNEKLFALMSRPSLFNRHSVLLKRSFTTFSKEKHSMKFQVGCWIVGFLLSVLSVAAQTASSASAPSQAPRLIQSSQASQARLRALLSRGGVQSSERQPDLPNTAPAAATQGSPLSLTLTFSLIDFPRSTTSTAMGIDDKGRIVGGFNDGNLENYLPGNNAFRLTGNAFSSVAFPGAVQTVAFGINKSGEIVGAFVDSGGATHGFTLVDKTYTQFDCPAGYTVPYAINDSGQIVGYCEGSDSGFLLSGGVFTTIAVPGANFTLAEGINDAGVIVGWYFVDGTSGYQGFVDNGGSFTTIDYPGYPNTYLAGINDSGLIVGGYGTAVTIGSTNYEWPHGFLYSAGAFTSFDAPFGDVVVTNPFALNNKGEIVGGYVDSAGMNYGFYIKVTQ
jgi:uncharacterized membrane protein